MRENKYHRTKEVRSKAFVFWLTINPMHKQQYKTQDGSNSISVRAAQAVIT
jgi:hypothetical protein